MDVLTSKTSTETRNDDVIIAVPALSNNLSVVKGDREQRLKELDGTSFSREGCSRILELPQKVTMVKPARRAVIGDGV